MKTESRLGNVEPDPIGIMLGTGYSRFSSPLGVSGLAKEEKDRVDILAVESLEKGKGNFSRFINYLQMTYRTVCVWEDWNPLIAPALSKRGFRRATETDNKTGEILNGWMWNA